MPTNAQWLNVLMTHIVIPELARWLQRRGADDPLPTRDEYLARMNAIAAPALEAGDEFLRTHGGEG
jgi:hypothetical protein